MTGGQAEIQDIQPYQMEYEGTGSIDRNYDIALLENERYIAYITFDMQFNQDNMLHIHRIILCINHLIVWLLRLFKR